MRSILADIRFALRQLRKSPGFTATAVLTLALGIGATTAIFTLVYQVMLRSLPVEHPEQLYKVGKRDCGNCIMGGLQTDWMIFSTDLYTYLRDRTPGTEGVAASEAGSILVGARKAGENAEAQSLAVRFLSGNYFSVLGVRPFAGRLLRPEDDREGASPVAVLSYTIWRTKFAADSRIIGATLLLTGHPVTVVGVANPNFFGERQEPDPPGVWLPLAQEPTLEPDRRLSKFAGTNWLNLLVRVTRPADVAPVQQAMAGELRQWLTNNRTLLPVGVPDQELARQTTELVSAAGGINDIRDTYEQSLKLLLLAAGFVLLIACANLANLMLARGMARQQELSVRTALGAPRGRLVRQMLVESLLLSGAGGVASVAVAYGGTRGILALAMRGVEVNPIAAAPSPAVFAFAAAVSVVAGLLFGLAPAWITSRSNPIEALRGANRGTRDASALPQKVLVIVQAALSLSLLSTAGLLITSLRHLEHQDFHLDPQGRLLLFIDLEAAGYIYDRLPGLDRRLEDAFLHLPGVESFAYAMYSPMTRTNWNNDIWFPGLDTQTVRNAGYDKVSPEYFQAVGTHVLLGRGITDQDTGTGTKVAVVNQTFVHRFLQGKQPLGEHFGPDPAMRDAYQIVGVVEDTKYVNPSEPVRPMFFTSMAQALTYTDPRDKAQERLDHYPAVLIIYSHGDQSTMAAMLRSTLKSVDPAIPILQVESYTDQLSENFTQEELVVRLTTLFGLLALLLASIGLYGVTAYAVARRTREIGIRMALGASRAGVLRMVLGRALLQALAGLAVGLPLCFVAGRLLRHTLYQTGSFQPLVLLAVCLLLLASALVAALIPARRAASIEPVIALRAE